MFARFDGKLTNKRPPCPRAAEQSAEGPDTKARQTVWQDRKGIWLCLKACCCDSANAVCHRPRALKRCEVRTGRETLCGASKTPHRGQLRDSPAQETINWNRVNWIAGAGHKMNIRASPRRRLGRRPCGKSCWPRLWETEQHVGQFGFIEHH